jgi:hypothetical protein
MKSVSRLFAVCALVVATSFMINEANAQGKGVRIGSHVGVNFDGTDFMIGLNSHFGVTAGERQLLGNPSIDFYLFQSNVSIYRVNLDVLYPFASGSVVPFFGAGLAISVAKFDQDFAVLGGSTDSDVGINLRLGAFFGNPDSAVRPFGDIGLTAGLDNSFVTARVGASFGITG